MSAGKRGKSKFYTIFLEAGRDASGERIRKVISTEFTRKQDAELHEADLQLQIKNGTYVEPTKKTVAEFFGEWLIDRKSEIKLSSWKDYECTWRIRVSPIIGHIKIRDLRPSHLMDVYRAAKDESKEIHAIKSLYTKATKKNPGSKPKKVLSPTSINKIHRFLHKFLGDAVRSYGYLNQNPADKVVPPRKAKYKPVVYDVPLLQNLFTLIVGNDIEAPVFLIAKTGMRSQEANKAKWSDIKGSTLFIPDAKTETGIRVVELPESITAFLKAHKARQNERRLSLGDLWQENGLIWCKANGVPNGRHDLLRLFHIFQDANKLPRCRIHDLRHAYVTHHLALGASPADLAAQVGHSSIAFMTKQYAHSMPTRREELAKLTDKMMEELPVKPAEAVKSTK